MGLNIKQVVGLLILFHASYSLMKYRKHLIFNHNQEEFQIPLDILVEIIFGLTLNLVLGIIVDRPFQNIHVYPLQKSYDQSLNRNNFRIPNSGRGQVLVSSLKKNVGDFDFRK